MRILLVTDDRRYAQEAASAAERRGVDLTSAPAGVDLDALVTLHRPNVVALDADNTLARISRKATVFATLHPRIATIVLSNRAPAQPGGSVLVVQKRRSPERLLRALEEAYLGLETPVEARSFAGE